MQNSTLARFGGHPRRTLPVGVFLFAITLSPMAFGDPVARWKFEQTTAPFADSGAGSIPLERDTNTTPPVSVTGQTGLGTRLDWQTVPGVGTRLYTYNQAFQTDSFGFSFWMKPALLNGGDNIIGKEMPATVVGPIYSRLAWQVQVMGNDGSGYAPLEFVVRGNNRTLGDFYGSVRSSVRLPLGSAMAEWVHVAGGYNVGTGQLSLFVNGQAAYTAGAPGADNSDGSAFAIGTLVNGSGYCAFAGNTAIDDMQAYAAPLSAYDAAYLRANPAQNLTTPFQITNVVNNANGSSTVTFNSKPNWSYYLEGSKNATTYAWLQNVTGGSGATTTATVTKATWDAATASLGGSGKHFRVQAYLDQPEDGGPPNYPVSTLPNFLSSEAYVPQYHFTQTWPGGSVGDPCGMIRYQGKYHLFQWDHATSTDLVFWGFDGWPFQSPAGDLGYWTGSAVVDKNNTAGFGANAMLLLPTLHNNVTGEENVGLASSNDQRNFYNYPGNPVLDHADIVFRDPDVFWHATTSRWIMVITRSAVQKVQIYTSPNLKNWTFASEFGPLGAREEFWEAPALYQVPVQSGQAASKWLMVVSPGTNKVQYFAGSFNGTTFTPDSATTNYLNNGTGLEGTVFANFENASFSALGWSVTGAAFGTGPGLKGAAGVVAQSILGSRVAGGYVNGDFATGTLTSPTFTITQNCINFLISGGNHPNKTCINLIVGGQVVRSATGRNSELLKWSGWDVSAYKGQSAQIKIVDTETGGWGHVNVDHIMFSNMLMNTNREHAYWVDCGSDFYAPRFLRDYDATLKNAVWMGWLGNWQYQAQLPTPSTWGKGALSIPRRVQLVNSSKGYQMIQNPIGALRKLRGPQATVVNRDVNGTSTITEFQPWANTYEIEATFNLQGASQDFGLNLCVGGAQKVVVGYDSVTSNVYLDRTSSGYVTFHPAFPSVTSAPISSMLGTVKFRIFVDQSSIEVFVNDGAAVLSSAIYPETIKRGIQVFSNRGTTRLQTFNAWQLATIWR